MGKARWLARVPLAGASGLCALLLGLCGCNHDDADRLARVSRKAAAKVGGLSGAAPNRLADSWQVVRAGWDDVAVDARVSARLRWDKGLSGAHIEVRANGGVVELQGTVVDANQRGHAVEVATGTVGVDRVTDSLELAGEQP
jgi:osmotically-inducible protein OsmY